MIENREDKAGPCDAATTETTPRPRTRNSEVSKKSILAAAQNSLAQKSYDEVGLREIAMQAKIDPALIIRYFGSKEGLFREVIKTHLHTEGLHGLPAEKYPEILTRLTLEIPQNASDNSMLMLYRSAASEIAGPIIKEALQERIIKPIVEKLNVDRPQERVELVMALLGGLSSGLHVSQYPTLINGDREYTIQLMIPLFRRLLFEPLPAKP